MEPKPIDPERLAALRGCLLDGDASLGGLDWPGIETALRDMLSELLADRDWLENEVALLRSRCPVLPGDITESGMTGDKLRAWLTLKGWSESPNETRWGSNHGDVTTWRPPSPDGTGICIYEMDDAHLLTSAVNSAAYYFRRDPWGIIDEVAAIEVSP